MVTGPGKSALDVVGVARQRCWRHAWVRDLDIQSFFDGIDSALLMRAVRKHTDCPWVLLYIERWLKAPVQMADGSLFSPAASGKALKLIGTLSHPAPHRTFRRLSSFPRNRGMRSVRCNAAVRLELSNAGHR